MTWGRQSPAHSFRANLHPPGNTLFKTAESICPFHSTELLWLVLKPVSARSLLLTWLLLDCSRVSSHPMLDSTWVAGIVHPVMQGAPGSHGTSSCTCSMAEVVPVYQTLCLFQRNVCRYVWLSKPRCPRSLHVAGHERQKLSGLVLDVCIEPVCSCNPRTEEVGFVSPNTGTAVWTG